MSTDYSMDDFIAAVRAIAAQRLDDRAAVAAVAPLARKVAADPDWVEARFYACDPDQGFGVTVLHEGDGPDGGPLIETVCWLPGRGVAPHDHQTWGVVVGIDGVERNVNWQRRDDGSRPGHADIFAAHEVTVTRGDTLVFLPADIHSVRNETAQPSLSLHIYGRSLPRIDRSEFDPATKTQRPCPKRKRNAAG